MRMSVRNFLPALAVLSMSGCADAVPEIKIETLHLQSGQSIVVDNVGNERPLRISVTESGYLFVQSEVFPNHAEWSDLSGIRKVYIFVPEKYVVTAQDKSMTITKSNGLQAFEYSKNDASPENYCFQELAEGVISVRVANGTKVVIDSNLKTPEITGPTDARCDASNFVDTVSFPI